MINFSLEKFRSSDATETFRVKNSDNVLTKSRKLETKSSWIIKLRSFFKFEKAKEPRLADFNFSLLFIYRSRCTCVLQLLHVFTACQSDETHDRAGAPNGRGPRFLKPAEPAIATPLPTRAKAKDTRASPYPVSTGILPHALPEWAFRARPGLWWNCLCPKVVRIAEHKF